MLARRLGRERARAVSAAPSLEAALTTLEGTSYGRAVDAGMDLATAQRSLAETTLWHLRVLSGWTPPGALEPIRALAGWFEIANLEQRIEYLGGGSLPRPFSLGGLATAWSHLADAETPAEIRAGLAGSAWGDPGGDDPSSLRLGLRFAWARRVVGAVEDAREWAAGGVALLLARELFLAGSSADELAGMRPPAVGHEWEAAGGFTDLRARLPLEAAWVLEGIEEPEDLWRAEAAWWRRVEDDAERLARSTHLGEASVIGTVVLLGVDAWRTAGALEVAARGGERAAREVFEEIG